jgi:flagellar basal-body rod protein FlgC
MKVLTILALMGATAPAFAAIPMDSCGRLERIRQEMDVAANNIVNAETTRTPEGGPYRMQTLVCGNDNCAIKEIAKTKLVYDPEHPDADENGYVLYPGYSRKVQSTKMDRLINAYEAAVQTCGATRN